MRKYFDDKEEEDEDTFFIQLTSPDDKNWECHSKKIAWPDLLVEFIYGLRGMGFFISLETEEKIVEACENQFSMKGK